MNPVTAAKRRRKFHVQGFLSTIDGGRTSATFSKKQTIFAQGESADSVFYIQKGKVRLSVVSKSGKEATIGILNERALFGEGCFTGQPVRMSSATAITECTAMRIDKKSMMEMFHRERAFSDMFVTYLLTRNIRSKRIWLTNFSIPAKNVLHLFFSCWLTSARTKSPKLRFPRSVRKRWQKWWYNSLASQLFHEQIPEVGLRSLQR